MPTLFNSFLFFMRQIQPQRWSRSQKRWAIYAVDALILWSCTSLFLLNGLTIMAWAALSTGASILYYLFSLLSRSHHTIIHSSNLYLIPRIGFNVIGTFVAIESYINVRNIGIAFPYVLSYTLLFANILYGSRITARYVMNTFYGSRLGHNKRRQNVLVYGAGYAGKQVVQALSHSMHRHVVGVIDDNKDLHDELIGSTTIYRKAYIRQLIQLHQVKEIIIAMPSIRNGERQKLMQWLQHFAVKLSIVPDIEDIVNGEIKLNDIKEVRIEDLLSRTPIKPEKELLAKCTLEKRVLVSGAGGSIGSEMCRQVLKQRPDSLILLEMNEFNLYQIERDLIEIKKKLDLNTRIIAILGDVKNEDQLAHIMKLHHPHTVYHAAAYKHVPLVESNAQVGFENNVLGTKRMAEAAGKAGVVHFVLVSTDKAVRPTNVMGATKRLAEQSVQNMQEIYPDTIYSMVRFGNVLGSSGSVIPLFRKQIAAGGPVTITHPEIIRYFMTIPEAASLVIQAGAMAKGGDVYLLDMGEPVRILDLAKRMIHLSGYHVHTDKKEGDIAIEYVGLRPGEKLYEELLIGGKSEASEHPRIYRTKENYPKGEMLERRLHHLHTALKHDHLDVFKKSLEECVEGYHPSGVKVGKKSIALEQMSR